MLLKEFFITIWLLISVFLLSAQNTNSGFQKPITVVIDAGHGGKDPGAIGKKSYEKTIALAIALKLGRLINEKLPQIKLVYTRKTDKFVDLRKRAEIANKNKADLFISIHVNSNDISKVTGTATYVMGLHRSDENFKVAKRENSVILIEDDYSEKYAGYDPHSPESYIIFSLMQNTYLKQSIDFATQVQWQFKNRARRKDRGVKQAGLIVLWNAATPGVLIETGFISNANEEKYLNSKWGQELIASAVFRAVRNYFKEYISEVPADNSKKKNTQVTDNQQNKKQQTTKKSNSSQVIFKVQVRSSLTKIPLNSRVFKQLKGIQEIKQKKVYKYLIGEEKNFTKALELQKKVRKKIPDAFVVAFQNGKRISIQEAKKLIQ